MRSEQDDGLNVYISLRETHTYVISTIYRKMKCFKHREENAVGLCKSCGRSLCPDCYTEVGDSLCCKGKCEEKVKILNSMIEKNSQILSTSNQAMKSAAKFSLMMGILFMGFGAWHLSNDRGSLSYFLLALGAGFVVNGILRSRKSTQFPNEG
mgnify:CR=1 FL=1